MSEAVAAEIVIEGACASGQPLRPSDPAEGPCGATAVFGGDHRRQCSRSEHPVATNGLRCVVADLRLEDSEPMACPFLTGFAAGNELRTRDGRIAARTLIALLHGAEAQRPDARTSP